MENKKEKGRNANLVPFPKCHSDFARLRSSRDKEKLLLSSSKGLSFRDVFIPAPRSLQQQNKDNYVEAFCGRGPLLLLTPFISPSNNLPTPIAGREGGKKEAKSSQPGSLSIQSA
jgi:hypothetical protein